MANQANNIVRLRTYADDVARAQGNDSDFSAAPPPTEVSEQPPTLDTPPPPDPAQQPTATIPLAQTSTSNTNTVPTRSNLSLTQVDPLPKASDISLKDSLAEYQTQQPQPISQQTIQPTAHPESASQLRGDALPKEGLDTPETIASTPKEATVIPDPPPPLKEIEPQIPADEPPILSTEATPAKKAIGAVPEAISAGRETNSLSQPLVEKIGQKKSIFSDEEALFDIKEHSNEMGGTIVTDTKRKRWNFFAAVWQALKGWFSKKQSERKARIANKPKIITPTERTDIIETAAGTGAFAPTDDFSEVSSRLREVERTSTPSQVTIKRTTELPPASWTHTTDEPSGNEIDIPVTRPEWFDKEASADAPEQRVNEAPLPAADFSVDTTSGEDSSEASEPLFEVSSPPSETVVDTTPAPVPVVERPAAVPEPAPVPSAPEPTPQPPEETAATTQPTIAEAVRADTPAPPKRQYRPSPVASSPSLLRPILLVSVLAIAAGVGTAIWWFGISGSVEQADPARTTTIPTLISSNTQTPIPLGQSRAEFLDILTTQARSAGDGITQLYPTVSTGANTKPATAAEIVSQLGVRAPGSFLRDVRAITFGTLAGETPFMIIETGSFDVSLSGMLAWEATLSSDMTPFFGPPVTETFDDDARTVDRIRSAFFVDTIISNRDVRLLRDARGDDRLLYSFIDQTTILITTDRDAFSTLAPQVR